VVHHTSIYKQWYTIPLYTSSGTPYLYLQAVQNNGLTWRALDYIHKMCVGLKTFIHVSEKKLQL